MAVVVFYEKPGCATNARQKKLLVDSGHVVEAKSLLTEAWTAERLTAFFTGAPVASWFNKAAPRVKSGAVVPEHVEGPQAIALMLTDPLLIRRPLMEIEGRKYLGFDADLLATLIGLTALPDKPLEGCSHAGTDKVCKAQSKAGDNH